MSLIARLVLAAWLFAAPHAWAARSLEEISATHLTDLHGAIAGARGSLHAARLRGDKPAELEALRILGFANDAGRRFSDRREEVERGIALATELDEIDALCEFIGYRAVMDEMSGHPGKALVQLDGAIALWQAVLFGSRPVFIIDVRDGRASLRSGKASAKFLQSCEEIAASASLATGTIRGLRDRRGISLVYSRDIPEMMHQQFRNAWHLER